MTASRSTSTGYSRTEDRVVQPPLQCNRVFIDLLMFKEHEQGFDRWPRGTANTSDRWIHVKKRDRILEDMAKRHSTKICLELRWMVGTHRGEKIWVNRTAWSCSSVMTCLACGVSSFGAMNKIVTHKPFFCDYLAQLYSSLCELLQVKESRMTFSSVMW